MASNAKPSGFCNCTSGFALQTDGHCPSSGPPKRACGRSALRMLRQHRTIPALRLKHRSGSCGTASALPKCSLMSGCGTRIVLRGQKPLALCDRRPCFGSLFPPLAALTFAASSIICAFGLASAAPRSPYRHLELCGNSLIIISKHEMFTSLPADISCILMKKEDVSHEKYPCNGRL